MKPRFALLRAITLALGLIAGITCRTEAGGGGFGVTASGNSGFRGDSSISNSTTSGSVSSGGGFSHSSGGGFSHASGGFVSPGGSMPMHGGGNFTRGSGFSGPVNPPMAVGRSSFGVRVVEPPSEVRSAPVINRSFAMPPQAGVGISGVPGAGVPTFVRGSVQPTRNRIENFIGVSGVTNPGSMRSTAPAQPSTASAFAIQKVTGPPPSPELRSDWAVRSLNRNPQWQQRVLNRNNAWNDWQQRNQGRLDSFDQTRDQRWAALQTTPQSQAIARSQNRGAWQQQRQGRWNFRADRANEIRSRARDFYDNCFDDRWWGRCPWVYRGGYYGLGYYPRNPWWWWTPATWGGVCSFVDGCPTYPIYPDYGQNVIYDGDTVYVDGQSVPASQYTEPWTDLAVNAAQPPPPTPPADGQAAEWMPLGVFALAQEEKGDPVLFLQLSVNRQGVISGAYTSVLTDDQRPIAGMVDRPSERVVWRIGANTDTIFETSLANLTQDVSPVAVHYGNTHTQTWLLVRMPPPAPEGSADAIPDLGATPPPVNAPAAPAP